MGLMVAYFVILPQHTPSDPQKPKPNPELRSAVHQQDTSFQALAKVRLPPPPQFSLSKGGGPQGEERQITSLQKRTAETTRSKPQEPVQKKTVPLTLPNEATLAKGRVLLRVLEHGKGPNIEIAWPQGHAGQKWLKDQLERCYGMAKAVMNNKGELFTLNQSKGQAWELNLDRYSGFVRQVSGRSTSEELRVAAAIRAHHGLGQGGDVVRLFPRSVDARLLGGLKQIIGKGYEQAKSIRATYALQGSEVWVSAIHVDGASVSGQVSLGRGPEC